VSQFENEVFKYVDKKISVDVVSYRTFLRENYIDLDNFMLVVDEAHNIRNLGIISRNIYKLAKKSHSVVFLSGTPLVNGPFDISKQVNILKEKQILPETDFLFMEKFYRTNIERPFNFIIKNPLLFKIAVKNIFSLNTKIGKKKYKRSANDYAKLKLITKKVKMTRQQLDLHEKLKSRLLNNSDLKLLAKQVIPKKSSKQMNAFLSQTRQLSNVVKGDSDHITNKLKKLSNHIIDNFKKPTIIYSNFLQGGLIPLIKLLRSSNKNFEIELFHGGLSRIVKEDIIEQYNKKKVDILCVSSSGTEGLDLKRTREIHIMEPHWNQMRIEQVIGRGWRKCAHANLNTENKNLTVYQWLYALVQTL
jgi:superfamily II DNA or RNA helicase